MIYQLHHKSVVLLEDPLIKRFTRTEDVGVFVQQFNLNEATLGQLIREGDSKIAIDDWDRNKKLEKLVELILAGEIVVTQSHILGKIDPVANAPLS